MDKEVALEKNIIAQIETYIQQCGGEYSDWYIGLADNPIDPIMEAYRNKKVQNNRFTYIETKSHDTASAIVDYFVNVCGIDGQIDEFDTAPPKSNINIIEIPPKSKRSLFVYKKSHRRSPHDTAVPL